MVINCRIGDLEVRAAQNFKTGLPYLEMVKWRTYPIDGQQHDGCYVLCFFKKEGIEFIDDRPFDPEINHEIFWNLCKWGWIMSKEVFKEEE